MSVQKYHPALIILHWAVALILIVALLMGAIVLDEMPNTDPEKIGALKGHMTMGILLLVLTVIRLMVRVATKKPDKVATDNPMLDKVGVAVHYSFYLFIILMATSGLLTALGAGLPDIVFGGSGDPLPKDFHDYPARIVHGLIGDILILMVVAHVAGAFYHQFKLKDNLISRMKL